MFHPSLQDSARNITGSVILIITALLLILNESQKVYILGLFKNPLYAYQKRIQKSFLMYFVSQFLQLGKWETLEICKVWRVLWLCTFQSDIQLYWKWGLWLYPMSVIYLHCHMTYCYIKFNDFSSYFDRMSIYINAVFASSNNSRTLLASHTSSKNLHTFAVYYSSCEVF